jgi:hypothetical protein
MRVAAPMAHMKTPVVSRLAHVTAAGLYGLGFLSCSIAAPLPARVAPALLQPTIFTRLDLRVPQDPFVPGIQGGSVSPERSGFPSEFQRLPADVAVSATREHTVQSGLAISAAEFHFASSAERFVRSVQREGLPIARLWKSDSGLLSIGLNKRGKPGVWFTKKLH